MHTPRLWVSLFGIVTLFSGPVSAQDFERGQIELTRQVKDVAHDAFIYAYPMMEQVKTINGMKQFSGLEFNKPTMNPKLPWDNVGMPIVAPNLTSMTGGILLDLSQGSVTLEIPEVKDRYIVYQCIDVFTHNFFYLGSRANHGEGGQFVFHMKGREAPETEATPVAVEGDHVLIVVRIEQDRHSYVEEQQ